MSGLGPGTKKENIAQTCVTQGIFLELNARAKKNCWKRTSHSGDCGALKREGEAFLSDERKGSD